MILTGATQRSAIPPKTDVSLDVKTAEAAPIEHLPIVKDKPLRIGGGGHSLKFYDQNATLPEWSIIPPVESVIINQKFGRYHTGIDLNCNSKDPIIAVQDGVVSYAGAGGDYGKMVKITHSGGFQTLYGHNDVLLVKTGQEVKQGAKIALCGSTGRSTGTHSHFEIIFENQWLNPLNYLQ